MIDFIIYLPAGTSSSLNFAALSKRVYGFKNVRFTSPVGPLRCLAIRKFTAIPSLSSGAVEEPEGLPVNLLIAKQRNGPTGDVNLTFLKSYTRFESAAKVSDEDVPVYR